ncbi:hypothetical protein [Amycolatopsis plumensis]
MRLGVDGTVTVLDRATAHRLPRGQELAPSGRASHKEDLRLARYL